ncbi:MAG: serine hydrolase domain-containing protein, partial [Candidatus Kapaibacterium sp.]
RFGSLIMRGKPAASRGHYSFSNGGYILAALMLEKSAGKSWEDLVADLGKELNIHFYFSYPNTIDTLQPWGHDDALNPIPPQKYFRENLLSAAGNISISLPDYARFVQEQLRGLLGKSVLLTQKEFEFLHFGTPEYSIGWQWGMERGHRVSYHYGSAGTFCSQADIFGDADRAYVILTNSPPDEGFDGIHALIKIMRKRYGG